MALGTILAFLIATASAAVTCVVSASSPGEWDLGFLVRDTKSLSMLCFGAIVALPLAFAMPRLRASFFTRTWRVPKRTYVLSRWMIWLCIAMMVGQIVGWTTIAIVHDVRLLWLAGSSTTVALAFVAGAWRRLTQHPAIEFTLPPWPRSR